MRLRAVRSDDLQALDRLEHDAFGARAWSADVLRGEMDAHGTTRWIAVAEDEGSVVGYVDLMLAGDDADLVRVAVATQRRRTGLGRAMIGEALDHAATAGCRQVLLEVAADNDEAIALYQDRGFTEIDRRPRYYGGRVDAVVMSRPVGPVGVIGAPGVVEARSDGEQVADV